MTSKFENESHHYNSETRMINHNISVRKRVSAELSFIAIRVAIAT